MFWRNANAWPFPLPPAHGVSPPVEAAVMAAAVETASVITQSNGPMNRRRVIRRIIPVPAAPNPVNDCGPIHDGRRIDDRWCGINWRRIPRVGGVSRAVTWVSCVTSRIARSTTGSRRSHQANRRKRQTQKDESFHKHKPFSIHTLTGHKIPRLLPVDHWMNSTPANLAARTPRSRWRE